MKQLYILTLVVSLNASLIAQSGLKLTDYYHNPVQFNPAYVGVTDGYYVKGFYTTQWLGIEGAPVTQTLDVQGLMDNERHAVGISILNDNFGAVQNFNFEANYALHLNLSETLKLALGLKVGLNNFAINYSLLDIYDETDLVYANGNLSETKPIIGAGFYLYEKNWFLGFGVPNIVQHRLKDDFQRFIYDKVPHFYSVLGYNIMLNRDWQLRNQAIFQSAKGAPLGMLFTSKLIYANTFGIGLNFQPKAAFGAITSYAFKNGFSVSYGYDVATSTFSNYNKGNHSLGLSFTLVPKTKRWFDRVIEDKPYIVR